ncbi:MULTISPECIES: phage baseplate assembly protein V [Symbiopectobacterium]|uniref:phage baseplate assembly protein V n=1 Tax=Symbiopectobacterium TaxID=801 RepID=UPI001A29725A|nr:MULTISPECIES: phage baseplate assembly protein V [Symbiopectobacterium]MBG6247344.1 phage baseplate assembly protein V [Candidatus Symbiopectobacterium sp. PLON1]MBT9429516.1 phage baseplate assembly protein V [Candidatus Symbiopectobacterium endolongispinus]
MSAELMRLLANILRVGVVAEVNPKTWRVRVKSGELLTDWLRWNTQRAGAFKVWIPPEVGEQVWLGCLGGNPETAVIIGSLYSDENPAPGSSLQEMVITALDGARFRYDAAAGALEAVGMKTARVSAETRILLDTPEVQKGGEMHGNIAHSGGAFTSNGVQIDDHDHGAVQRGGSWTEGTK